MKLMKVDILQIVDGMYRTFAWNKDPSLFQPWITLTNISLEAICAISCSNEFRRGQSW